MAYDTDIENVTVSNCVIEDIGGCYASGTTRYGNGIAIYNTNASNIVIKNNIIRNVYDAGITIQGTEGSSKDITVKNNAFVNNSQDCMIVESDNATGISNLQFTENVSVNQGRGWGCQVRSSQDYTGHILFGQYIIEEDTDINFSYNIVYNPYRLYYMEQTNGTDTYFKDNNGIQSDYNTYQLTEETLLFGNEYTAQEKDTFISDYNKDANSTFSFIEVDESIVNTAATSNDIKTVNKLFKEINEEDYVDEDDPPVEPDDEQTVEPEEEQPVEPDDSTTTPDTNITDSNKPNVSENTLTHTHVAGDWVITKDATATAEGLKVKKCTICDTIMESKTIPKYTVSFNVKGTIPLQVKQSTTAIKATAMDGDKIVSYKSSNKKVATVTKKGKITGKKTGTAKITVTTKKGAKATIKIKVQKGKVKTKKLTISKKKLTLQKGKSYKLTVTKTPITSLEKITYSSSNKKVATVSSKGKIKAKKKGTAKITIKCGTKKATVKVTVK